MIFLKKVDIKEMRGLSDGLTGGRKGGGDETMLGSIALTGYCLCC